MAWELLASSLLPAAVGTFCGQSGPSFSTVLVLLFLAGVVLALWGLLCCCLGCLVGCYCRRPFYPGGLVEAGARASQGGAVAAARPVAAWAVRQLQEYRQHQE